MWVIFFKFISWNLFFFYYFLKNNGFFQFGDDLDVFKRKIIFIIFFPFAIECI
jgi:hypothetical protein